MSVHTWLAALPAERYPRDPSASEAADELSKQIYQDERPSLLERFATWVEDWFAHLLEGAGDASPGGGVGVGVFLLLVVALIGVLIWRFGLPGRTARVARVRDQVTPTRSAAEHSERADAYAAEGRWAEAVRERLRAVVAGLVVRDLVDNRPGRTAHEVAEEAGRALPTAADDLGCAAEIFAEVWYGGRDATAEHDQRMRTIASRVAAAQPGPAAAVAAGTWVAPGSAAPAGSPTGDRATRYGTKP